MTGATACGLMAAVLYVEVGRLHWIAALAASAGTEDFDRFNRPAIDLDEGIVRTLGILVFVAMWPALIIFGRINAACLGRQS